MSLSDIFARKNLFYAAAALLVAVGTTPAIAQQGIVDDWSNHQIKFMNPGSEMDALMNGHRVEWQTYVSNPRYRAQQIRHSAAFVNRFSAMQPAVSHATSFKSNSMQKDWAASIAPSSPNGQGTAQGVFPAEYGVNFDVASCNDYVVFPVNQPGASGTGTGQANLVGFNNLYKTTCTGTNPKVMFAYYVGTGTVQTSPVLSLDGTKVAFVESVAGGSNFHVLTLGTTGNNGSGYASPAVAHTIVDNGTTKTSAGTNNATDAYVTLNGSAMVTRSSPFIDYTNDLAYVGDDNGALHKFTGVFQGTLAEVTTGGWPFTVANGTAKTLTSPVLDSGDVNETGSSHIFVGANDGNLYCVAISGGSPSFCGVPSISVANEGTGAAGPIFATPIVVSSASTTSPGWVFEEAVYTTQAQTSAKSGSKFTCTSTSTAEAVLMQTNTSFSTASTTRAVFGTVSAFQASAPQSTACVSANYPAYPTVVTPRLLSGDFDNTYYNGSFSGHYYFAGMLDSSGNNVTTYNAQPALWRAKFTNGGSGSGQVANVSDIYTLASNTSSESSTSTPAVEFYNGTTDYLYLGVSGYGAATGCGGNGCMMNFTLPTSGQGVSITPTAEYSLGGNGSGSSAVIVDGDSTAPGASQIYLGNLVNGTGTQVSQSTLN